MSGPKVVRVRTREERQAECLTLIDSLRAAIEGYEAFAGHHDLARPEEVSRRAQLLRSLQQSVAQGSFDRVESICAEEQAKLRFERDEIEREVIDRAASVAQRRRRSHFLAEALIRRMQDGGRTPPPELKAVLDRSSSADLEQIEAVVSRCLAHYTAESVSEQPRTATSAQQKLAATLSSDAKPESLAEWAVRRAAETTRQASGRLDTLIEEITALDASEAGSALFSRARRVRAEPDTVTRTQQIDSLLLEWATRRRALRERAEVILKSQCLLAALERTNEAPARELSSRLKGISMRESEELPAILTEAEAYLAVHRRTAAAIARRQAVLRGLATLGYEIGSELATATPASGRIVVRKPDHPAYGVEVMVPREAERMQVKVVAVAGAGTRDSTSDRDAETLWCSDLSRLQEFLRKDGSELAIEKALGVGVVPLPQVSLDELNEARPEVAARDRTRRI